MPVHDLIKRLEIIGFNLNHGLTTALICTQFREGGLEDTVYLLHNAVYTGYMKLCNPASTLEPVCWIRMYDL